MVARKLSASWQSREDFASQLILVKVMLFVLVSLYCGNVMCKKLPAIFCAQKCKVRFLEKCKK